MLLAPGAIFSRYASGYYPPFQMDLFVQSQGELLPRLYTKMALHKKM